jgi:acetylornithine deacetylase/succinyl-diaminopimelate desuccinylase-like protein
MPDAHFDKPQHEETLRILRDLIRIDTSNPPGNETACCEYIRDAFAKEGIDSEIIEGQESRGSIVARLKGDGSAKPLMLTSHIDVVPADASKWSVDPFGAEIKDGRLWGRGSIDTKNLTAVEMAIMLEIKRRGIRLKRDLIFSAVADEEQAGTWGMHYLVENHWDKIACEYSINEGGGANVPLDGKNFYFVQTAEKGVGWYRIRTRGESGHGSVPKPDNALVRMGKALMRLSHPMPVTRTPVVDKFITRLARGLNFPKNLAFPLVFNPVLSQTILNVISTQDKQTADMMSALLRDTISPTMINAGYKENVIPEVCEAVIDCRILPGQTHERFMAKVQRLSGVDEIEMLTEAVPDPTDSEPDTELFSVIARNVSKHDPTGVTIPFMVTGATDSRFLRKKGVIAYGFCPMKSVIPPQEYVPTMHGVNEFFPLDSIPFSFDVLWDIVVDMCS